VLFEGMKLVMQFTWWILLLLNLSTCFFSYLWRKWMLCTRSMKLMVV